MVIPQVAVGSCLYWLHVHLLLAYAGEIWITESNYLQSKRVLTYFVFRYQILLVRSRAPSVQAAHTPLRC